MIFYYLPSHRVPEILIDKLASEPFQILDTCSSQEFEVSNIPRAIWVGLENFSLD